MRKPVNELVFKQTNGGFRIEKYSQPYLSGQTIQYNTWWACFQTNMRWIKKRKCTHCHICLSRQYKCSDYGKSLACMFHWEAADYHLCLWIRKYDTQTQREKTTKTTIATWKSVNMILRGIKQAKQQILHSLFLWNEKLLKDFLSHLHTFLQVIWKEQFIFCCILWHLLDIIIENAQYVQFL